MRLSEAIALIDNPLLREVTTSAGAVRWADLGCGNGLFTEALAHFLSRGSTIYGIDLRPSLYSDVVNGVVLVPLSGDFVEMPLPAGLDGILMANSLHYVKDKEDFLKKIAGRPLVIIEYDTDRPVERWVPYPVSHASLRDLLLASGWSKVERLGETSSVYGHANIYAALAYI